MSRVDKYGKKNVYIPNCMILHLEKLQHLTVLWYHHISTSNLIMQLFFKMKANLNVSICPARSIPTLWYTVLRSSQYQGRSLMMHQTKIIYH